MATWINTKEYDQNALKRIGILQNSAIHVRVDVYNLNDYENKLGSIEGLVTGGNINVDGKSSVRRNGSLSLVVNEDDDINGLTISNLLDTGNNIIATNREVEIFIGVEDIDGVISDSCDIYEFKQGRFVMKNASITHNTQGLNISLTLSDLMSKLNGDIGGVFSTAITHHPELYDTGTVDDKGNAVIESRSPLIKDIITTLVHEYGQIPLGQIELDPSFGKPIKNAVRWVGNKTLYTYKDNDNGSLVVTTMPPASSVDDVNKYTFNDNIGYQLTDFTFPGKTLESNAGETIVSVLEKIKNAIGDYEYYFDINGKFQFKKIDIYDNDGSDEINMTSAIAEKYLFQNKEEIDYNFEGSPLITSYQNDPQWLNLKNDITVWGQKGDTTPIWYHLIIGEKYSSQSEQWTIEFNDENVPKYNSTGSVITNTDSTDWRAQLVLDYITEKATITSMEPEAKTYVIGTYWESYAKELEAQWPKIYDFATNKYKLQNGDSTSDAQAWLNALPYYFDALDYTDISESLTAHTKLKDISIETIGSREKVITNKELNVMFSQLFEDVIYVVAGHGADTKAQRILALQHKGDTPLVQIPKNLGECVALGSTVYSLYDCVRSNLHELTSYNETISVTMVPVFYLEPNKIASFKDDDSKIDGSYVINSFSIPLAANGTMTLNCSKAIERI